eukprot:Seg321.1 transcript_id=Seg321.1/GoldUCD/mRNA.D3Y31 product="hypothetical protein" protein_id=Seg321.1/GoldUCD/D3Y31
MNDSADISPVEKLKSGGFEILESKVSEQVPSELNFNSIFENMNYIEKKMVCDKKVIVSHEKLIELKGKWCAQCGSPRDFCVKEIGAVCEVSWSCKLDDCHEKGNWASLEILCKKKGNVIYANSRTLSAAILISGNSYQKVQLMLNAAHIQLVSCASYYRIKKTCAKPVITKIWREMHQLMVNAYGNEAAVLCGDGWNDSPGHSARFGTYILMSQFSDLIVDVEVMDKRETGGNSTVMERECLKKILMRLKRLRSRERLKRKRLRLNLE